MKIDIQMSVEFDPLEHFSKVHESLFEQSRMCGPAMAFLLHGELPVVEKSGEHGRKLMKSEYLSADGVLQHANRGILHPILKLTNDTTGEALYRYKYGIVAFTKEVDGEHVSFLTKAD